MFIVVNTYIAEMHVIEGLLSEHLAWVKSKYEAGTFIASGRRRPWTGSIIFALSDDQATLENALAEDPLARAGAIESAIIEVDIARAIPALESLVAD